MSRFNATVSFILLYYSRFQNNDNFSMSLKLVSLFYIYHQWEHKNAMRWYIGFWLEVLKGREKCEGAQDPDDDTESALSIFCQHTKFLTIFVNVLC